jgi:hypothetical protein
MRWLLPVLSMLAAPVALAQGTPVHPDLHGVWESRWLTPLERPPGVDQLSVDKAKAIEVAASIEKLLAGRPAHANPDSDMDFVPALVEVNGQYRTSLVVDPTNGVIPYNADGQRQLNAAFERTSGYDNPEERIDSERCTAGNGRAPILSPPTNAYIQFIQTSDTVVIWAEALSDLRILPLGGNLSTGLGGLQGVSSTRWDGDTLIVETSGFRLGDDLRIMPTGGAILLSPETTITERFRRMSDLELLYSFTVSDPGIYTAPWTAETVYRRTDQPVYEYACHEANHSLANILLAGRARDASAAMKR